MTSDFPSWKATRAQPPWWPCPATCARESSCETDFFGSKPSQSVNRLPGSDCNEMILDLEYGLSPEHISLSPPHGPGTRGCRCVAHGEERQAEVPGTAPLSS